MRRLPRHLHLGRTATLAALFLLLPLLAGARQRVVILGFDGADAALTQQYMEEGKLPNLQRLAEQGSYAPLATTNPPQTPVSWSSFATGLNPGRTGIFDFLKRIPNTYLPELALIKESRRAFLLGERTPLALGLLAALLGLALGLLCGRLLGRRRRLGLGLGLALAAGLAWGVHGFAGRYLPRELPTAHNNRQGETMWSVAARNGLKTRIIRVPATFPAEHLEHGEFLSGLGVPDIRGTVGTFSLYTTTRLQTEEDTEFGGKIIELAPFEGSTETIVYGPRNKLFYERDPETGLDPEGDPKEILLPMRLERRPGRLLIEVSGQRIELEPGAWSDWVELSFPFNALIKMGGIARFHLLELEPNLKLYLSPINLHPRRPPAPISHPGGYAWELKQRFGWYKTLGWAIDTWSFNEKVVDEEDFLADVEATVSRYEEMLEGLLAEDDYDLYVQVFNFTDRVAHVFFSLLDPTHPAYDAAAAERYGQVIEDSYRRMDAIVGKALELTRDDPELTFMVVSDHGFATWRRAVNYNTWLVKNGFMTLKTELGGRKLTLEDLFGNRTFWPYVDWSRTRAYSLGLGNLYVNLRGREPQGIVSQGPEYERLLEELQAELEAYVDPETGEHPIRRVYRREDMYRGYDPELIPDLRIANNPGYRVSWQSSLGATPPQILEDNSQRWSGDHCSLDPEAVPGIIFSNRPLRKQDPAIVDIMPSVLELLGLEAPTELDGSALF